MRTKTTARIALEVYGMITFASLIIVACALRVNGVI